MQIVVDSLLTTYSRAGKGKIVVLLHGWGDSMASFKSLENKLAQSFDVISVDLPGFGQTQAPRGVWGLNDYAHFVDSFLEKTGVEEVYGFIGHSNGGALLIRGLGANILKSQKLVLIASAGVRPPKTGKRLAFKVIAKTGKAATFFLAEKHKRKLRKKLYGAAGSDMLVVPHLHETFKKTVRQDVQKNAAQIKTPTLLVYGKNDTATPVTDGEKLHKLIKKSKLKVIDGADHYVHQQQPELVLKYIKEFLNV